MSLIFQLITDPIPVKIEITNPEKGTLQKIATLCSEQLGMIHARYCFYHRQSRSILDPKLPLPDLHDSIVLGPLRY